MEEGTYRIDASSIPSDLSDAVKIYLSGKWDTDKFKELSDALGNNSSSASSNNKLMLVDMSNAEIAVGTNLMAQYPGIFGTVPKGIFQSCKALETVVMPMAEQAANLRSFQQAFQNCESLTEIDLSGCTGITSSESAFFGCSTLAKVVLPGNFVFKTDAFDRCNALATVDWSLFEGTEAPAYKTNSLPTRGKDLTIIVPTAAYDSFTAASGWSGYNIVAAGSSGIGTVETVKTAVREVYTISGIHVGTLQADESASTLPAGLYIIGGRKVLVK